MPRVAASTLPSAWAAMLAGLPQAPSLYDPYSNMAAAKDRQAYVLDQMVAGHAITGTDRQASAAEDISKALVYDTSFREARAPHFVDYVMQRLEGLF